MAAIQYRLLFEHKPGARHITETEFKTILIEDMVDLPARYGGYISVAACDSRYGTTGHLWQALIYPFEDAPANFPYAQLAARGWEIAGHSILLFVKPGPGENEILFPIWKTA